MKSLGRQPLTVAQGNLVLQRCWRYWLIVAWAIASTPWMAFGQFPDPSEFSPPPAPAGSASEVSHFPAETSFVRDPCDPDYWIISTRCAEAEVEAGVHYDYQV